MYAVSRIRFSKNTRKVAKVRRELDKTIKKNITYCINTTDVAADTFL